MCVVSCKAFWALRQVRGKLSALQEKDKADEPRSQEGSHYLQHYDGSQTWRASSGAGRRFLKRIVASPGKAHQRQGQAQGLDWAGYAESFAPRLCGYADGIFFKKRILRKK